MLYFLIYQHDLLLSCVRCRFLALYAPDLPTCLPSPCPFPYSYMTIFWLSQYLKYFFLAKQWFSTLTAPRELSGGELCWVFVAESGLSPVAESRAYSPVSGWGLLIAVASLAAECGLLSTQASVVAVVVTHGPSSPEACGIFLDQGSNPCLLHWQADSYPLHH